MAKGVPTEPKSVTTTLNVMAQEIIRDERLTRLFGAACWRLTPASDLPVEASPMVRYLAFELCSILVSDEPAERRRFPVALDTLSQSRTSGSPSAAPSKP